MSVDLLLDTVDWKKLDLSGCSFVGEPGALYATHEGTLHVGPGSLRCYQMNDGQRVFDADDVANFLTPPATQPEEEQR